MGSDYRLGVVTALWRRPAIAEVVLRHYARLSVPQTALSLVAARSPGPPSLGGDPEPAADVPGWEYTEAPNLPLSDKWNTAVRALRGRVDGVMIVGSDDLCDADYVFRAVRAIRTGTGLVYSSGCVFVDTATGRAIRNHPPRLGAGRVISARLLDTADWAPWPPGISIRLDAGMDERLREARAVMRREVRVAKGLVVDLKSGVNLWPFDVMQERFGGAVFDAHPLLAYHFPQVYEELTSSHILASYDGEDHGSEAGRRPHPDEDHARHPQRGDAA